MVDTETGLRFRFSNYAPNSGNEIEVINDGTELLDLQLQTPAESDGTLTVTRINGEYSFYNNSNLIWQQTIPTLDGIPLYYGVANAISSGPGGLTAETAFDDLSFSSVPEPSTLVLLAVGTISLLGYAWRRRKAA